MEEGEGEGEGGDKEVAKEEVKSSGTAPERVLYHVIMMLVRRSVF